MVCIIDDADITFQIISAPYRYAVATNWFDQGLCWSVRCLQVQSGILSFTEGSLMFACFTSAVMSTPSGALRGEHAPQVWDAIQVDI